MFTHYDVESMSPICLILYPNNSLPKCLKQAGFGFSSPPLQRGQVWQSSHSMLSVITYGFHLLNWGSTVFPESIFLVAQMPSLMYTWIGHEQRKHLPMLFHKRDKLLNLQTTMAWWGERLAFITLVIVCLIHHFSLGLITHRMIIKT